VVLDPENGRVEVVVAESQLSLAIGRRGQNVRLASQLTGWQIDIMTEGEESERRQKEMAERTELFMLALDVDEIMAQLLASEGFEAVEDIAYIELDNLVAIEGFSDELAEELQARAKEFLDRQAQAQDEERRALGVDDTLVQVPGMTLPMAVAFGKADVKTQEDLAGLVPDDIRGWFETKNGERVRMPGYLESFNLTAEQAEALILEARIGEGWIDAPEAPVEEAAEGEAEETEEARV
jgi:transcription termination/antitermination protein NusA